MTVLAGVLAALLVQAPQTPSDITALAAKGDTVGLVREAQRRPAEAREAIRELLARAAEDSANADLCLVRATHIARALETAWQDPFAMRQVTRFRGWGPDERRAHHAADSLWASGNEAFSHGDVATARERWRSSATESKALGDTAGVAAALGNIGTAFYRGGMLDSAMTYLIESRDLAIAIHDQWRVAGTTLALGAVQMERGDLAAAAKSYTAAASVSDRYGNTRVAAAAQNNLGHVADARGDLEGARRAFEAALAVNRASGHRDGVATNLTNLANLAMRRGRLADAVAKYEEALGLYRELDARLDAADVLYNLGLAETGRGNLEPALAALTEAIDVYEVAGWTNDAVAARQAVANVHAAMGQLGPAMEELHRAQQLADLSRVGPDVSARLALARGDLALRFNYLDEAEREYVSADSLYRVAGLPRAAAGARQGRALVFLTRDEPEKAAVELQAAISAQETVGDGRGAAWSRILLASAEGRLGQDDAARQILLAARDSLRAVGDAVGEANALLALGDVESELSGNERAASLYRAGVRALGRRPAASVSWRLHAALGTSLRARGALVDADHEFRTATEEIEEMAGSIPFEERRTAFLTDKWDPYTRLALTEEDLGRLGAAFEVSERMRARAMLDLLARGRLPEDPTPYGALVAREQDLRREIARLAVKASDGTENGGLRGYDADWQRRSPLDDQLSAAEQAYAEILRDLEQANPAYKQLIRGESAPWHQVASSLTQDQALVEYLVADSTTLAFVVTSDTIAGVELTVGHAELAASVEFARQLLIRPDTGVRAEALLNVLERLYGWLVEPLEGARLLLGKSTLLVVPHAELHYLPFGALLRSRAPEQYLIERYDVVVLPSASIWTTIEHRARPVPERVLALAPSRDQLPGSEVEMAVVRETFGAGGTILSGPGATEAAFRTAGGDYDILHLATYGRLNKVNPLFSFVTLNPGNGEDGRLHVFEIFDLQLRARLVVLSACETGLGSGALADVPPGDDWVGLVRAFLYAGANTVVATLWPVEDRSTAELMSQFYRELARGAEPSTALARAQRTILHGAAGAHTFTWAAFVTAGGT